MDPKINSNNTARFIAKFWLILFEYNLKDKNSMNLNIELVDNKIACYIELYLQIELHWFYYRIFIK